MLVKFLFVEVLCCEVSIMSGLVKVIVGFLFCRMVGFLFLLCVRSVGFFLMKSLVKFMVLLIRLLLLLCMLMIIVCVFCV